jgi:TrmH family RNA methyltransferase
MKTVASRDNAAFKAMARLASNSNERRRSGLSVLDGAHLLAAFLDSGRKPEEVMVSRAGLADPEVARLIERSAPARVTLLSDALFGSLSELASPTGVIASVRTPTGRTAAADAALVLLLDDVQDPGNVGTLLRSAAAAGADSVILSSKCAFAWSPKVLRSAMGGHFALNIVEGANLGEFVRGYRGRSIALAPRAKASLYDTDLTGPCAFLVGAEGAGLSPELESAASARVRIPMPGRVESLNAATAGSICLFEAVRQRVTPMKKQGNHR